MTPNQILAQKVLMRLRHQIEGLQDTTSTLKAMYMDDLTEDQKIMVERAHGFAYADTIPDFLKPENSRFWRFEKFHEVKGHNPYT